MILGAYCTPDIHLVKELAKILTFDFWFTYRQNATALKTFRTCRPD